MSDLGIRKSKEVNIVLQLKLIWKILAEPENIWVKIITEKYLKQTSILRYQKKGCCSWQLTQLSKLIPIFKQGIRWNVCNGEQI